MPYLSSTQLPGTLVFLLLPGKSPFGAKTIPRGQPCVRSKVYTLLACNQSRTVVFVPALEHFVS